jgi:hypothetical protein
MRTRQVPLPISSTVKPMSTAQGNWAWLISWISSGVILGVTAPSPRLLLLSL